MEKRTFFAIVLVAVFSGAMAQDNGESIEFDTANVTLAGQRYEVEFAQSPEQRAQGLMFRKELCDDCGMLFQFTPARRVGMWMKNTFIPLDVAFIKADGVISDIKTMQPHDLNTTFSSEVVSYSLEMNQGWFSKHSIGEGDKITIDLSGSK